MYLQFKGISLGNSDLVSVMSLLHRIVPARHNISLLAIYSLQVYASAVGKIGPNSVLMLVNAVRVVIIILFINISQLSDLTWIHYWMF